MSETGRYFEALFGRRPPGSLIAVSSKARGMAADFYEDPQAAAAACAGGVDVYARVTPLRERPPLDERGRRGRGDAALSAALLAVWTELDVRGTPDGRGGVKADGFETVEHAIEVAVGVIAPTLAVASGGGLHAYLVLAEPLVIANAADLERAGELERRYQQAIRLAAGDVAIDSTHDLARVLRPPGTFNGKGDEPRPVAVAMNGGELVAVGDLEAELPPLEGASSASGRSRSRKRAKRAVTVDDELVELVLADHRGLETLSARSGGDPSANDYALACAAARERLDAEVIEQLLARRLMRHGDPKGKATMRDDYIPRTVERALAEVERERRDDELGDPLAEASAIIGMSETPIVAAEERQTGVVILDRADGRVLKAASLEALAKPDRLKAAIGAAFGHKLKPASGTVTDAAVDFVSALRRHFGPAAAARAAEQRVAVWMIELVRAATEVKFTAGEEKASAWKEIDEAAPDTAASAPKFAGLVVLARDKATGERYLRASWAHEYLRRCGWKNGPEDTVDMLLALGLEQPNADGRVRGGTLQFRFWVIPAALFERWSA